MFYFKMTFVQIAVLSLVSITAANFDASAKTNVAMYYGQGSGQQGLAHFCQQSTVDIIPIGFVNIFPAQGDGYPGTNFGNQCGGGVYSAPGYNGVVNHAADSLLSQCPSLGAAIPTCQAAGKKIILSLGGGLNTYQLTGATDGEYLADFLWGAFGPQTTGWVTQGRPRPFDVNGQEVQVDGFDFDIEFPSSDQSAGYIALINRLRTNFATNKSKNYLITGAPQCVVPDANMGTMINAVAFDIIWVQFYNTPQCSARSWVNGGSGVSAFSYDTWSSFLAGGASANAKLYIGLLGSPSGTIVTTQSFYLSPSEATSLIGAYFCKSNFGGVMLWEATAADNNVNSGRTYYQAIKAILLADAQNPSLSCGAAAGSSSKVVTATSSISQVRTIATSISKIGPPASSTTKISNVISTVTTKGGIFLQGSSTSAISAPSSPSIPITTDGSCGPNRSCKGFAAGECCSQWGWCGSSDPYCGSGCQSLFGICGNQQSAPVPPPKSLTTLMTIQGVQTQTITKTTTVTSTVIYKTTMTRPSSTSFPPSSTSIKPLSTLAVSTDGTCGINGKTCGGSDCCSQWGWCGIGIEWCGTGCQSGFGICY